MHAVSTVWRHLQESKYVVLVVVRAVSTVWRHLQESKYVVLARHIPLIVRKAEGAYWPRLLKNTTKVGLLTRAASNGIQQTRMV